MDKKLQVRIYPDGRMEAKTEGILGEACTDYIKILEEMLDGYTTDMAYTSDYYQEVEQRNEQTLMG